MPATSLLTIFGKSAGYENFHETVDECMTQGIARRVPLNFVPEGLEKGLSKVFCAHPDALFTINHPILGIKELISDMFKARELTVNTRNDILRAYDEREKTDTLDGIPFLPEGFLQLSLALSRSPHRDKYIKHFEITFTTAIFGYAPYTGIKMVLPEGTEEIPDNMKHLAPLVDTGYIEPVHVKYFEDMHFQCESCGEFLDHKDVYGWENGIEYLYHNGRNNDSYLYPCGRVHIVGEK